MMGLPNGKKSFKNHIKIPKNQIYKLLIDF